LIDGIFPEYDP